MRLLHAGIHSDDQGVARTPPATNDGRDPSLFIGKFVPLRCLSRHCPCGTGSRGWESLGNACCSGGPRSAAAVGKPFERKKSCEKQVCFQCFSRCPPQWPLRRPEKRSTCM